MNDDPIIITREAFTRLSLKAFEDAGRHTIERMMELDPEHADIIRAAGQKTLAEIGAKL